VNDSGNVNHITKGKCEISRDVQVIKGDWDILNKERKHCDE